MDNKHTEWTPSRFIHQPHYAPHTAEQALQADRDESLRVKDHVLGNRICTAISPTHAKWIADRLNLAAKLEKAVAIHQRERPCGRDWEDDAHALEVFIKDASYYD